MVVCNEHVPRDACSCDFPMKRRALPVSIRSRYGHDGPTYNRKTPIFPTHCFYISLGCVYVFRHGVLFQATNNAFFGMKA